MQVLHLENNQKFSLVIENIVKENGFVYKRVKSHEEIFKYLKEEEASLLIIDHHVRCILHDELIKKMMCTGFVDLPIIVITAEEDAKIRKYCFDFSIMAYFKKKVFDRSHFEKYLQTIKREYENIQLLRKFKIAVIEANRLSIEVIKTFFLVDGIKNVDYYQNPLRFLKKEKKYNLIFIDLLMLEYDVDDMIAHIRERKQDAIIILITAYNNGGLLPHCLSFGADNFIMKPLEFHLFMARVHSCLGKYYLKQEIMKKNEKLFELATRDGLTNLYNRRYFVDVCKNKLEEFYRTMQPFSFILLDIDYFKNINDEYGHLKGDYVLKEFARLLRGNIRKSDILCRWGGEEFIILLMNTEVEKAVILAEKIRLYIEKYKFKEMTSITASFGVIQCQADDDAESVFKRLDNSLYLAKMSGRNKVVSNEELEVVSGEKPMAIEWGPFFRSGNSQIDEDHHKLITMSNELIYNAFKKDKQATFSALFLDLAKEIGAHFSREEKLLKEFEVDIYTAHKQVHKALVDKTLKLIECLQKGEVEPINVVKYLIKDVVVGHIIKSDFDFFHIFRGTKDKVEKY
jgi:diguanylate cyclase (GGDEF)-like protein/hemerythrin-like metal-binding protein